MFSIQILDRQYDAHRSEPCTVVTIGVDSWPGNEFGLWLPEAVHVNGEIGWSNWGEDACQTWQDEDDRYVWRLTLSDISVVTELRPDPDNACIWLSNTFHNHSPQPIHDVNVGICFQMVNAPQFISIRGERLWAHLDGTWDTTDHVHRHESPDWRRIGFLRHGVRTDRTLIPNDGFPSAILPQCATHPLFMAEDFQRRRTVGIAAKNFRHLFNNNDSILRCLHSTPFPISTVQPNQHACQEAVLLFVDGDHHELIRHFEQVVPTSWHQPE